MNKLPAFVYRHPAFGDSTNAGLSSRVSQAETHFKEQRDYLADAIGYSTAEAKEIAKKVHPDDFVIVEDECYGKRLRAIPAALLVSGVWTMFGGNYLATSDSRFFENPVKIHDRVEG